MGRYDQNPTKKNTATTFFVVAVVVALTLGIVGNYYVLKRHRNTDQGIIDKTENIGTPIASEARTEEALATSDNKLTLSAPDQNQILVKDVKALGLPAALPELLNSDDIFRQILIRISPELATWLTADQLIRRFLIVANDFSQGQRLSSHMSFIRLDRPFTVALNDNTNTIDPDSYSRYNRLAQAVQLIDAKVAVAIYKYFRPLMLQVFAEFSYPPDITLETIIKKAAADIIAAPVIEQPIALVRPSVYYKYADAGLEDLSPVQKQMLRMGPQNTRIIQVKLREFMVEFAKANF